MLQVVVAPHIDVREARNPSCSSHLLEKAPDSASPHSPNVYRITATALAATGHPTLASLQASIAQGLVDAPEE